jgi:hypothetical protein
MAQPELEYFKKKVVLLKPQIDEDLDPVPTASDGFRLYDGSCSTEFDAVENNEDTAHFGNTSFSVSKRRATIQGGFMLYPPSAPGQAVNGDAYCERVLFPAGFARVKDAVAKITRYNPISSAIPSLAGHWYQGASLLRVLGLRADLSDLGIAIDDRFMGRLSLMGPYEDYTDAAMPNVTLPTFMPVVATKRNTDLIISTIDRGGTLSTISTPLEDLVTWSKSIKFSLGKEGGLNEYTGGKGSNRMSNRKGTFSLQLAKTDITNDFNPIFVRDRGIHITAAFRIWESDSKVGLYSEIGVRGQLEQVTAADIQGDYGWDITGRAIPSSAGNDEVWIAFGDTTP